jgi:hypothetical protein
MSWFNRLKILFTYSPMTVPGMAAALTNQAVSILIFSAMKQLPLLPK